MSELPPASAPVATPVPAVHRGHGVAHHDGPRWIPVAAALLAVLSAVSGYLAAQRQTNALIAKNDAVVAVTRAADVYNEYEAAQIKYSVYQAVVDAGIAKATQPLRDVATSEQRKGPLLLDQVRRFDDDADRDGDRAQRLVEQHDTIAIGTTLFEIAIVLVSISALVGSRLLPVSAAVAALLGLLFVVFGLVR